MAKNYRFYLLLLFIGIVSNNYAAANFVKQLPQFSGGIKPNAIWDSHMLYANYLESQCHSSGSCVAAIIKKLGAGKQAVAFASWKAGLITNYKSYGNIYYFAAWLPGTHLRRRVFIGNKAGQIFQVDNWLAPGCKKPLHHREIYLHLLARSYHNTQPRYGVELRPIYKKISHNSQQLIFNYPLIDRCNGIDGCAQIGFDFNQRGEFIKAVFLGIKPYVQSYKMQNAVACNKSRPLR